LLPPAFVIRAVGLFGGPHRAPHDLSTRGRSRVLLDARQIARLAIAQPCDTRRHFGHDFRTFTGLTPTRYLDLRRRFLREHPGDALDVGSLPAD
jgi:hypothetical protein